MLNKGKYKAFGVSGEFGESKQKGTPYVKVQFRISGGADDGASISWDGYFTETTEERTIQSLRHCGCTFPGGEITNLEGIDRNEVELVVEHESYTNENNEEKVVARVAWVNGGSFGIKEEQKMTDTKKKQFAARMKGKVLGSAGKSASPNAAPAQRPAQQRPVQNGAQRRPAPEPDYPVDDQDAPF